MANRSSAVVQPLPQNCDKHRGLWRARSPSAVVRKLPRNCDIRRGLWRTGRLTWLAGLMMLILPLTAQAWWNGDWSIRKKITVDTTATGDAITEPIGSAPVLLRLHDGNFQFSAAKDDGSDIRLVAEEVMPHVVAG